MITLHLIVLWIIVGGCVRHSINIKLEPASDITSFGSLADVLGECVRHGVGVGSCK